MLQVCGNCEAMTTSHENICCSEVDRVVEKKEEGSSAVSCIIDHEGFHSVCLDVWVLQTTYFNYRQHYGVAEEKVVQLSVVISFSPNYLSRVRKHKDMIIFKA